jgi:hypothetical protein
MKKTVLTAALASVLGFAAMGAHAAAVNTGDQLTINPGVVLVDSNGNQTNVTSSYFGMDTSGNSKISGTEKTAISMGTTGIIIGTATTQGASHVGAPTAGDTNAITAPWGFFGNTGSDYTLVGITGSTTAGLDMSGWTVTWAGIPAINMTGGAWGTGFTSGIANFSWSGVYGTAYTLDYTATVPVGDPSGFGGVKYSLHLEGIVNEAVVPVPAAAWLFGSGLMGLVGVARRKANKA